MQQLEIREFILSANNKMWRIYGTSEQDAKLRFLTLCRKNSDTNNDEYRNHWTKIHNLILEGQYVQIENEDFKCAREIV